LVLEVLIQLQVVIQYFQQLLQLAAVMVHPVALMLEMVAQVAVVQLLV
jgi:hypothetical protein